MPCAVDAWSPLLVGKVGRVISGIGMLIGAYKCTSMTAFSTFYWISILLTVYVSKYGINLAFYKQNWGEMTRIAVVIFFLSTICFGQIDPEYKFYSMLLIKTFITIFWIFIGIAYILCGILGVGGCELNAYHIIWNHFKYNRCSCNEVDCAVIISPIYLLDKLEMMLYNKN